ncbi:hypothetical protein D3C81_1727050 [compost metagenome]
MTPAPVEQALGRPCDGDVGFGQGGRRRAHLDELAQAPGGAGGRVDGAFELHRKHRRALPQTQEDVAVRDQVAAVAQRQPDQALSALMILDQGPPLPQHHGQGLGIGFLLAQPGDVVAKVARAVERIAGEDVGMGHGRFIPPTRRRGEGS